MNRSATILACTIVLALCVSGAYAVDKPIESTPQMAGMTLCPGPDNFGYTCLTNCRFEFINIATSGMLIADAVGDDVLSAPVAINPINIYGNVVNSLLVSSNGFLSTNATSNDLSNDCPLPVAGAGKSRISALWDDLETDQGAGVFVEYFAVCPRVGNAGDEPCTVFMWDANHFPGPGNWLQEVILYHSTNDIVLQVGDGEPEMGLSATAGIQNDDGTDGLDVAGCNTAGSIPNNSAFCIVFPGATPVEPATFGSIKALYRD